MAGSLSDYAEDAILDHLTGKTAYSKPTVYVGLSTADPLDSGAGLAEPSGNNYARVTTSGSDWNAASGGATANAVDLTFNEAGGSWGLITHFALFNAISGGQMLAHADLDASKQIDSGDTPKFAIGELDVTLN